MVRLMIAGRVIEPAWPVRLGFFAVPLAAFSLFMAVTRPPEPSHTVVATFGGPAFRLAVADTGKLRDRGLQGRPEPEWGEGMLFSFEEPQQVTVEMKTVPYRIDVVFVGEDGRVLRTVSMQPEPLGIQRAMSGAKVRYVVEARGGTLIADGLVPGDRFEVLQGKP